MPVHGSVEPDHLCDALDSVTANTVQPAEVVVVLDGLPPRTIRHLLESYRSELPIRTIVIRKSTGLGAALALGLSQCRCEWVARADSDDICMPDRFEKQIAFIRDNPDVDAFSAPLIEFTTTPGDDRLWRKQVPLLHDEIVSYARWRNPLNHPAVMLRRRSALAAGNYRNEPCFEDYSLWLRMLQHGARLGNMKHPVVFARAGKGMQLRRGGLRYALHEIRFLRSMRTLGILSRWDFCVSLLMKIPIRLMPGLLRHHVYSLALRT